MVARLGDHDGALTLDFPERKRGFALMALAITLLATMDLWAELGLDIVTLGQYLRPSLKHWEVARYVDDATFDAYRVHGEKRGIPVVYSGAFVRSSYHAGETFMQLARSASVAPAAPNRLNVLR